MQKSQEEMIQEIYQTITQLSTVLLGVPNTANGGLVKDVKSLKVDTKEIGHSLGKLKKSFWLLVGVLIGTGIVTGWAYFIGG